MNKIEAKEYKTKYSHNTHLHIFIDNRPIDELISLKTNDKNLLGLVPTLLDWLDNDYEKKIIKENILNMDKTNNVPICMCPDDCDFDCTLLIVEIENREDRVIWKRFGTNVFDNLVFPYDPLKINWFSENIRFEFDKDQYQRMINKFEIE